jgi:hypothetical protein
VDSDVGIPIVAITASCEHADPNAAADTTISDAAVR